MYCLARSGSLLKVMSHIHITDYYKTLQTYRKILKTYMYILYVYIYVYIYIIIHQVKQFSNILLSYNIFHHIIQLY